MEEVDEGRFYPVTVVARKLCCSIDQVYDLLACKRLKGIKLGVRYGIRVQGKSLKEFIEKAEQEFEADF